MSASSRTASPSPDNFTVIFNSALSEYQRVTGKHLETHPFAPQLVSWHSPEAVSEILRTQVQILNRSRKGDEKLMKWLRPTVNIIFSFSSILAEGTGSAFPSARAIFTGIVVLLGTVRDAGVGHDLDMLTNLFERIHFFLQRLSNYAGIPLTEALTEVLGKIMAELPSLLAFSTKMMTDKTIRKLVKKFMGRNDVEDALLRLDSLTKEECLMVAARNLDVTHHVDRVILEVHGNLKVTRKLSEDIDDNIQATKTLTEDVGQKVNVIEWIACNIDNNVKASKSSTNDVRRSQLRENLRTWLSPPDPSINHNAACATQHGGTAKWFIQGSIFRKWRENSPLLWIQGSPGAGKSVLCSAIIEDIENTRGAASTLIAYYYFDFKDASKCDVRGLLASLLFQLGDYSDRYWDVLHQLYTSCRDGAQQPSEAALAKCLKAMLELSDRVPIFIILDALDECPSHTGTPSAREKVLDFVEDLVLSGQADLSMCITSRPEQDIQAVLNPLISPSSRVSLHEERGQREDINNYIRSFVHSDRIMRRWREEDKELVIRTLSKKANGMFRWVYCQLDTLRRCMPSSLHKALNELPTTLDDTYEQTLRGIPKEKWQHAHRLFQCLVAAFRPLRVEELAETFAVEFDLDTVPNLVEDWRPENPEEAVLSACSTLIAVVEDEGSKYVRFSHFSVKEFLTSDRLRTSDVGDIRQYHISLDSAHITLVRACLAVLLRLDEKMDKKRLATFPLAFYAAQHWVCHAKFGDATSQIQNALERLFDPHKAHLASWTWIHDVDRSWVRPSIHALAEHPSPLGPTALYYAVLCGFGGVAKNLVARAEDADARSRCGYHGTVLHAALCTGNLEIARVLPDHGANANLKDQDGRVPLVKAYDCRNLEAM